MMIAGSKILHIYLIGSTGGSNLINDTYFNLIENKKSKKTMKNTSYK